MHFVKRSFFHCIIFIISTGGAGGIKPATADILLPDELSAEYLRCEYRVNPLGIDADQPRLSWILESRQRQQQQTAYRILVSSTPEKLAENHGDIWDSGKVTGNRNVHILYRGKKLESGRRYHWKVRVWNQTGRMTAWSEPAWWEMGLLSAEQWRGKWIGDGKLNPESDVDFYKDDPAPLFRKSFTIDGELRRARLYISAAGYYAARVNGRAAGEQVLEPAWTAYDKRIFYSTYDVTDKVTTGKNALAVMLGNGWRNPLPLRMWGRLNLRKHLPVGRPCFTAQLVIDFADGRRNIIATDNSWKTIEGPVLRNNIYLGEIYDARREISDWDNPTCRDKSWRNAAIVEAPGGVLFAQPLPPIKPTDILQPIAVSEPQEQVYIFDMGENFTGWVRLTVEAARGTNICLRYGELLHEDGRLNPMTSVAGQIKGMQTNQAGEKTPIGGPGAPKIAWQSNTYIARGGGKEVYVPRFTFHAFRYVELSGYAGPVSRETIEGIRLHSAVKPVGEFRCSNELLNQIQRMCRNTFVSNLMGVQSDCPHRERFGYGGDIVATSEAFMMNYDMAAFYAKTVRDWHDAARKDGMLTDTAPFVGIQYCGLGWAMVHPLLQWQLYRYYGDRRLIEEQYATAKRWFDLAAEQTDDLIIRKGLSDHEALVQAPSGPMVTPLFCESARIMARLAALTDRPAEARYYRDLAGRIRQTYQERFWELDTGRCSPGTQASQSFALYFDMIPEHAKARALANLIGDIVNEQEGKLTTGIMGTRFMADVLSRQHQAKLFYDMVNRRDFPGWGYMLDNGATTLWEHWALSTNTYSHNHPMFGSVSLWFYRWLGGIQVEPDAVGCDRITLRPQLIDDLDWVRCRYESIRGRIMCNWRRSEEKTVIDVQIPVNVTASLVLPIEDQKQVKESGGTASESTGVESVRSEDGKLVYRLSSGRYEFSFIEN